MIANHRSCLSVLCGGLLLAGMAGCSLTPRVHDEAPTNYSLSGVWELNTALSSDAQQVLASLTPKPKAPKKGSGNVPGGPPPAPEIINDPTTDLPPIDLSNGGRGSSLYNTQNERNTYRPPIDFQTNAMLGGEWLKITQTDTEMSIMNAARSRTYTFGQHSVVSVTSGVADQATGWKGHAYVVFLTPQIGPAVQESYALSPDGRQLLVKITVGSEGRNKSITVKRTYDRSNRDPSYFKQNVQETLPPIY